MVAPVDRKPKTGSISAFAIVFAAIIVAPFLFYYASGSVNLMIVVVWLAGAASLGVLSGYTTGASEHPGTAGEFFKFIAGGILVPLVGAAAALLQRPQTSTERYTYEGTLVAEKITETAFSSQFALLHPLAILGSFFVVYALFALLGIMFGIADRAKGFVIKPN